MGQIFPSRNIPPAWGMLPYWRDRTNPDTMPERLTLDATHDTIEVLLFGRRYLVTQNSDGTLSGCLASDR